MKTCKKDTCTYPVFGKGYCKAHQYLRTDTKKTIPKISKKLNTELKTYSKLRAEFLEQPINIFCAVYPDLKSTEIHHMRGRGRFLNDTETWVAVSRQGHEWIEANPKLAKERGYTKSRINIKA